MESRSTDLIPVTGLRAQLQQALGAAYLVERELGGGGMSHVFVAEEVALGRRVVVKVLAPALAEGLSAERFKREVRLAARLQHPHIVPLLAAGALAGGLLYYTMPFVTGEGLPERLARDGALPVAAAVSLLRDVTAALGYAHRQGVVHRDVKPANVLLAEGGAVVADFGIAKAVRAARGGDAEDGTGRANSATITQLGTSVGTPQYMAPEQAAGDSVDHRADLYALGVVAYELLSGRPPFEGRNAQQLLAAHAVEIPEPLARRRPAVPDALAALVMHLLQKHPADRPQSADEVLHALDEIARGAGMPTSAEGDASAGRGAAGLRGGRPMNRALAMLPWVLVATEFVVIAVIAARRDSPRASAARPVAAAITAPAGVEPSHAFGANFGVNFALSPDGAQLAFVASDPAGRLGVWIRPLASLLATRVDGTDGASGPFWSPDGTSLGFFAGGELKTLDLERGTVRSLCPVSWAGGAAWTAAGVIVYSPNFMGPLYKVDAVGGACTVLTRVRAEEYGHRNPTVLPDRNRVLFSSTRGDVANVVDVATGAFTEVRRATRDARFAAPDWLLFVVEENGPLYAQRLDLKKYEPVGEPRKLLDRVLTITGVASYTAAPGALVAQEPRLATEALKILWVDRQSVVIDSAVAPEGVRRMALAHNGRRVALAGTGLWLYDRDRRVATRVRATTLPAQWVNEATWDPGDSLIAYTVARAGPLGLRLYHLATDASDLLFSSGRRVVGEPHWSPDGQRIAFTLYAGEGGRTHEIWIYSFDTHSASRAWESAANTSGARWAPDGRWLAYTSDETGAPEVYVRPAAGPGASTRISTAGGQFPRWRRDARELYYQRADGSVMAVDVDLARGPRLGAPRVVLAAAPFARTDRGIEVTADGQTFVSFGRGAAPVFTLLLDWAARLGSP